MNKLVKKKNKQLWADQNPGEDSIKMIEKRMEEAFSKFGKHFKNKEEFEFFWMLPLNDENRFKLLRNLWEEKKFKDEVESCEGVENSTPEHRKLRLECCTKIRPSIAVAYH